MNVIHKEKSGCCNLTWMLMLMKTFTLVHGPMIAIRAILCWL
uniref:Alternative protein EED n=1 Tax=Homo sapiens TaxID=9606 RepID=L8E7I9_HUMAN|nr:alternative protein EED [Homo sapiens]